PDEVLGQCRRWERAGADQLSFGLPIGIPCGRKAKQSTDQAPEDRHRTPHPPPAAGATAKNHCGAAESSPAQRKDNGGRTAKRAQNGEKPPRRESRKRGETMAP
ncbi:hypothetical protein ACWDFH_08975, partial [Streptomyces kronopolitis]